MNTVLAISSLLLVISPLTSAVVTEVSCTTSGSGICADPFCNVTPDGNVDYGCGNFTIPLYEIWLSQNVYVKVLGLDVVLDDFPDMEFCALARGDASANPFFDIHLRSIEEQTPGIVHECPYQGKDFNVRNYSLENVETYLGVAVTDYTVVHHIWNSIDDNIYTVKIVANTGKQGINLIKSPRAWLYY